MKNPDFKVRYDELYNLYNELFSAHQEILIEIGALKIKNEVLKNLLIQNGVDVSSIYSDF